MSNTKLKFTHNLWSDTVIAKDCLQDIKSSLICVITSHLQNQKLVTSLFHAISSVNTTIYAYMHTAPYLHPGPGCLHKDITHKDPEQAVLQETESVLHPCCCFDCGDCTSAHMWGEERWSMRMRVQTAHGFRDKPLQAQVPTFL